MSSNENKSLKIGIVGYPSAGETFFGVGVAYMQYFSEFGDVEIISHTETEVRKHLDLLVIPGGPDVDTSRYLKEDEKIHLWVGKPCPFRERFDAVLLPKYIENKTPIFGICRGHQTLAVHFGGTLVQHMYHETNKSSDREELVHGINIHNDILEGVTGFKLEEEVVTKNTSYTRVLNDIDTNSIHHQVVKDIPSNAIEIASYKTKSTSKGKIAYNEALIYPKHKIASVQYHPEEIYDALANHLINWLISK